MSISQTVLTQRFEDALVLATRLHAHHRRKVSGVPYVSHLLAVASLVLEHGGTEDEVIAALLHDAVEDQGGRPTLERIRAQFGDSVALIVEQCSESDVIPKPPWQERKEDFIAAVPHKCASARLVSLADKVHNLQAVLRDYKRDGDVVWQRFKGSKDGTLWFYRTLAAAYQTHAESPPERELAGEMSDLVGALDACIH